MPKALAPTETTVFSGWTDPPGPGDGQQNSLRNERHQKWSSDISCPDPLVYQIDLQVAPHSFTTSQVLPIDRKGQPTVSFDANGKPMAKGAKRTLPPSTIYGFNGQFPAGQRREGPHLRRDLAVVLGDLDVRLVDHLMTATGEGARP